jgi:hypothetical protein
VTPFLLQKCFYIARKTHAAVPQKSAVSVREFTTDPADDIRIRNIFQATKNGLQRVETFEKKTAHWRGLQETFD